MIHGNVKRECLRPRLNHDRVRGVDIDSYHLVTMVRLSMRDCLRSVM